MRLPNGAWLPFVEAAAAAPRLPGVYMAKDSAQVVYVGMAAERRGQGIRGRLTVYRRGRAAVSGLGEAAMDRALRDPVWLRARLEAVEKGADWRTRDWATAALERAELQLRWATRPQAMPLASLSAQFSMLSPTSTCGTALDSAGRLSDVRLRVGLRSALRASFSASR